MESGEKKSFEIGPAIEVFKSIGVIVGSLGSVAFLFFWIGNAIIVARLRTYNLYGVIHYTDEYVQEAGYQFFQDIFTFFQQWDLILLFILATSLVITSIPVGPFSSGIQQDLSAQPWLIRTPMSIIARRRDKGIHYLLFLGLALLTSISLTSNWGVRNLSLDIINHERVLTNIVEATKDKLLVFVPKVEGKPNRFQQRFYDTLTSGEEPTRFWLSQALSELYPEAPRGDSLSNLTERFQKDFEIKEKPDFKSDEEFKKSVTYQTLLNIRLTKKLGRQLRETAESALLDVRQLLSAHLTSEEDFSSLVMIPANYDIVNDSIRKTQVLYANVLTFFRPVDEELAKLMSELLKIRPLRFGSVLLSFSFWVLMGILAYLLLNISRILKFRQWEIGYFFFMLLLFLTIVVALPTSYGRYKFEFKIQKVNDIVFSGNDLNNPIKRKLEELWEKKAMLYILGPTRGREVIVGAVRADEDSQVSRPQILMLDRGSYNFMIVEPVQVEDIQQIIKILRRVKRPS